MTISDHDGLSQTSVGNHIDAVSVDLSVRPPLVRVVGDARAVDDGPVVTAVMDRGPDSDRFWFFEATEPLTSPNVFASACALYLSVAYLADSSAAPSDRVGQATAVVLRAKEHNVYLITADTPSASPMLQSGDSIAVVDQIDRTINGQYRRDLLGCFGCGVWVAESSVVVAL